MNEVSRHHRRQRGGRYPRTYNFADDILRRNLDAGRAARRLHRSARKLDLRSACRARGRASACAAQSSALRRSSASCSASPDTIDWPTAFLGAIKAGASRGAVNTLPQRDRLPVHADRQPRHPAVVSQELYPRFAGLDRVVARTCDT